MDFDPTPYMNNPLVFYVGLFSAVILALKGSVILLTELIKMLPPLIMAIKDTWKYIVGRKNGHNHEN